MLNELLDKPEKEKIMYFHDGSTLTYEAALQQLAEGINRPDFSPEVLEIVILFALENTAILLNSQNMPEFEDQKILAAFYAWSHSIHNENLVTPKDARFPNNIVYDMIAYLRKKPTLTPQEMVLRFFLEGVNARKISKVNTPGLKFIATSLVLDIINAVRIPVATTLFFSSETTEQFMRNYESLKNYTQLQRQLEDKLTELKKDPLYGFLTFQDVFEFEHEENKDTGANRYLIDKAIQKGLDALKKFDGELNTAIQEMFIKIKEIYDELLPVLSKAEEQSTEEAHLIAIWDMSEWFARLYTALKIVNKDIKHPLMPLMDDFPS